MKFFGWKSAGREASRPVLSRGFSTWSGAGSQGEWPRAYEPQVRDGYIGNPVAQRAVRLVSEGVGSAPVTASDPAALALVAAKSGGQSLVETMAMHLLLHGNAYVQVLADADGSPRELFALRPERVTVEADARGWPAAFLYKAGTAVTRLAAEDARGAAAVIHVKTPHPLDDHYGLGCLGAAAGAIAIHNAATRWNKALLDNAARPSGALVYEPGEPGAVLAAEQFARLRAELDASFVGAGNAGRPMLLEGGLKWQSLSLSPADMDFVGLKAAAAREIALAFGVPPMLLGLPGDATYANYREANKALWRLSVLPMAGLILEGIAQGLRPHFAGLTLAVDLNRVTALSEDRERLWAQVEAASFLTLDEKRAALGFGPVEVSEPVDAPDAPVREGSAAETAPIELKFNPWHDADDGKFTFANRGKRWDSGSPQSAVRTKPFRPGGGSFGGGGATATGIWGDPPPKRRNATPTPSKPLVVARRPAARTPEPLTTTPPRRTGKARRPVVSNGYRFEADTLGRTARVSGALRLDPSQRRSRRHQLEAGKPDRQERDHGGHFIAREFGGPEIALNHFAQDGRVNKGEYRKLELRWKSELERGRKVSVNIRPVYSGASKRPDRLEVAYSINGSRTIKSIPNRPEGK